MRHTARTAARPPRPHRHRRRATPQHPRPSPPPRPQRPPAIRAPQLSSAKPLFDPASICPYREHSASARDTALPGRLGQTDTGRAFVCPHRHGAAANEHDHRPRHTPRSVGTQHAGIRTRHRHPQRRSTTARPWRSHGELVDLPAAILATGAAAGLIPAARCVALLAGLRGSQLIPRPSFFQLNNVRKARRRGEPWHLIVHEDVLIFRAPLFPGGSRELNGSQREPKHAPPVVPGPGTWADGEAERRAA